jgi:hypothetical protein
VYISEESFGSTNQDSWINSWDTGGILTMQAKVSVYSDFASFSVTDIEDFTTW